jgi:radical SAM superfamily enzyme YgiQ (UPF0313 family)
VKIYLVAPRNPESFWTFDRILPSLKKRCVFPNLALPTLAALTPPEHAVVLCDENVRPIDFATDADVVGITGYVVHRKRIFELVDGFKRRGKLVVVGGPFASLCPEELRGRADVVFVDEAEDTWPEFLRDHAAGNWRPEYVAREKPNLHDSPCPCFELLDVDRYRTMTIQTARGCAYGCEFCDIVVMYGRRPRTKTVDQVMTELRAIHRLGASNVFVVDDNFIGNKREAKKLLAAIAAWQRERRYPIELMTDVSLNVAQDEELLRLLREANFTTLFVGIESPRTSSLLESGKTQNTREDMMASIRRIQEAGIEIMAGMIVGFDSDDGAIFDEHFRFIQDARIPVSMTGMLNALPRTPLHERLRAAGRLVADNVGDQFVFTNVVPYRMSRLELYEGYKRLLQRLYEYRSYRERAMALVLNRGRTMRGRWLTSAREVGMLLRLLWTCIVRASPRRAAMTVRMIGETAVRRPRAVRHAAVLALLHKLFYEYVRDTSRHLDRLIEQLRSTERGVADASNTARSRAGAS